MSHQHLPVNRLLRTRSAYLILSDLRTLGVSDFQLQMHMHNYMLSFISSVAGTIELSEGYCDALPKLFQQSRLPLMIRKIFTVV